MNRYGICMLTYVLVASTLWGTSCEDGESSEKFTLSEALPATVVVTIDGDRGTIQFDLVDDEFDDERYDAFVELVSNGIIDLTVVNNETSVSVSLTSGSMVHEAPASAGEYQISMNGQTLEISFFNEFEGAHIYVGGDYSALVEVMENDEFTTESFVANVEIQ